MVSVRSPGLGALKISSFALLHSNLFGIARLSAPISSISIRRASIAGLVSDLLCAIPFVVVQILASQYRNTWTVTVALSFALSCISIASGIIQRMISYCIDSNDTDSVSTVYVKSPSNKAGSSGVEMTPAGMATGAEAPTVKINVLTPGSVSAAQAKVAALEAQLAAARAELSTVRRGSAAPA